jgi:hypothetical protein
MADLSIEERKKRSDALFAQFKDKPFWIWDPHEHLLAFLKTQKKCCFNHLVGKPDKWDRPQPLF